MTAERFRIATESPLTDDVRGLVAALNAHLKPLSPPQFQFQLTAEQMADVGMTVFIARDSKGQIASMGALKRHDDVLGEVKRMFTSATLRGVGIGKLILAAIEAKAGAEGLSRLALETGNTAGFEPAWALYERAGYVRRDAFPRLSVVRLQPILRKAAFLMTDLTDLTIAKARDALTAKRASASDLTEAYLAAIEASNARLNAYVAVTADKARAMAKASRRPDRQGRGRRTRRHSARSQGPVSPPRASTPRRPRTSSTVSCHATNRRSRPTFGPTGR